MRVAVLLSVFFSGMAHSLSFPSPPTNHGTDSIRTPSGFSCTQSISSPVLLSMGVVGGNDVDRQDGNDYDYHRDGNEAVAYISLTVPLGDRPERLECGRLYNLELQRLSAELEMAKEAMRLMALPDDKIFTN